ncbi:MAG: ABC transporter ATP-binding protein [Armatimonadetes bacterium]|nr:ABC transporter ATP-binding protein [Armatimonadota bacterium]
MGAQPDHLLVRNLTKRFPVPDGPDLTVLDGVSLTAQPGEAVAIVGPSGSGKSTLLNLIGALDSPTAGEVYVGGVHASGLAGAPLADFRATSVGFVFQEHHLLPQLTALENVLLPTLAVRGARATESDARATMERLGLAERLASFPAQLSGGERQRVALARALVNGARLLLCDEPTGNLDAETGTAVVTLLLDLARTQGVTVLMVTHNSAHAQRFGRCLELRAGCLAPAV